MPNALIAVFSLVAAGALYLLAAPPSPTESQKLKYGGDTTQKAKKGRAAADTFCNKWSAIFNVPYDWLMGICYNESNFNALAVNLTGGDLARGGAFGMTQQTWKTALGNAAGLKNSKNAQVQEAMQRLWHGEKTDLYEPELAILFAAYQLANAIKMFGRLFAPVVGSYNRGPGAIQSMIDKGKDPGSLQYVANVAEKIRLLG